MDELKRLKESSFPDMKPFPEYTPLPELTEDDLICPTCGQSLPKEVREKRIYDYEERKKNSEESYKKAKTESMKNATFQTKKSLKRTEKTI